MLAQTEKLIKEFEDLKDKFSNQATTNIIIMFETASLIEKATILKELLATADVEDIEKKTINSLCRQLDDFYAFIMDLLEDKLEK